MIMVSFNTR